MNKLKRFFINFFEFFLYLNEQINSLFWLVFVFPIYYVLLRRKGYKKISLFKYFDWHLSCRYLLAYKKDKKFFVKCGKYFLIHNEITAISAIKEINSAYVTNIYGYILNPTLPVNFIILEYLDNYSPLSAIKKLSNVQYERLNKALYNLLDILDSVSIIHRDFSPSNIFINIHNFSDIKLIDFAMSAGRGMIELDFLIFNKLVFHSLGCKYRVKNNVWCDRYSVDKILTEVVVSPNMD